MIIKLKATVADSDGRIHVCSHETEAASIKDAKTHFNWNYIISKDKNPASKFPGGIVLHWDVVEILVNDIIKKEENEMKVWEMLKSKLVEKGIINPEDSYVKFLRKKFNVRRTNIDDIELIDRIIDFYLREKPAYRVEEKHEEEENEMKVKATKDEVNLVNGVQEVIEPEHSVDGLLSTIEHDMQNTEHVLNSFTIKKYVPKLEPINAYVTNIYDPVEDKDREICVRFYDKGKGVFLGIIMFKPEGWKTFSDLRGDFKRSYKTLWEYDSIKKLPKYMVVGGNNNGNVYKLGFDDRIDNTMRELYKCLVKWHKDEIERAKIRKEKEEYKKAKRAMSSHKN